MRNSNQSPDNSDNLVHETLRQICLSIHDIKSWFEYLDQYSDKCFDDDRSVIYGPTSKK